MSDTQKNPHEREHQAEQQRDAQPQQAQEQLDVEKLQQELQEVKQHLEERDRQLQEMTDRLKRLQADFDNYKKRVEREREEFARIVEDRFLLKILPIYDNLERAFRSYNHNNDKDSFIEGLERIFAQFSEFLRGEGVQPIEALGKPFDPLLHEALLSVETDKEPPNVVLEEFERGYVRAERVLRPSRVKVSRRPAKAPAEATPGSAPAPGTDEKDSGSSEGESESESGSGNGKEKEKEEG